MTAWSWLFRPARAAHPAWHLIRTAAQIVVFWGTFLWLLPTLIVCAERQVGIVHSVDLVPASMAWALFGAASALGLWSGITMSLRGRGTPLPVDCPTRLVVSGPYAHIRNPMAMAGLIQGAAVGLLLGSLGALLYAAAGLLFWDRIVRPIEEADLQRRFGLEFTRYRQEVRCWRFRIRPYRPGSIGPESRPVRTDDAVRTELTSLP